MHLLKCYDKHIDYILPQLVCSDCEKKLVPGDEVCTVVIKWGSSKTTCRQCYDKYEIEENDEGHEGCFNCIHDCNEIGSTSDGEWCEEYRRQP